MIKEEVIKLIESLNISKEELKKGMDNMDNINYEKLRSDLIDYYGTAISYNPMAVVELSEVECASNEKLIQIARKNGFDLSNYEKGKTKRF